MQIDDQSVDDFLRSFPDGDREVMSKLDEIISAGLPGQTRKLWTGKFWGGTDQSIIGYADLVFSRPKKPDVEWFAIGLARQTKIFSLYVVVTDDGVPLGKLYAERLGKVKVGASSLGFKRLDDI